MSALEMYARIGAFVVVCFLVVIGIRSCCEWIVRKMS